MLRDSSSDVEISDDIMEPVIDLCSPENQQRIVRLNRCRRRLSEVTAFIDLCSPVVETNRRTIAVSSVQRSTRSNANRSNRNETHSDVFVASTYSILDDITEVRENTQPNIPSQRSRNRRDAVSSSHEVTSTVQRNNLQLLDTSDTPVLRCPICFESTLQREPTVTKCGHVFCRECIELSLRSNRKCPLCKSRVCINQLLRIYL